MQRRHTVGRVVSGGEKSKVKKRSNDATPGSTIPRFRMRPAVPTHLFIQFHISHCFHSLLSCLLFLEQLLLARLITAADSLAGLDQHVLRGRGKGRRPQQKNDGRRGEWWARAAATAGLLLKHQSMQLPCFAPATLPRKRTRTFRNGAILSRARILLPTAAWITTSKFCRSIFSFSFWVRRRARPSALLRSQMAHRADGRKEQRQSNST